MNESIRLGRIAGVRVGLNLSVLVILAILVIGLAFGRFPEVFDGYTTWAYVLAAALAAVGFLASLLAHEMAHAMVATRHGIDVEGITLWLLGGLAELRSEARTPKADFQIAFAGPLTSLGLGLVLSVTSKQKLPIALGA